MNRLVISTYAANYENYSFFDEIMKAIAPYDPGVEITLFDDKHFLDGLMAEKHRFDGMYTTFHGAFGGLDFTAPDDSEEFHHLVQVYKDTFDLSKKFNARSIVYHTQRGKKPDVPHDEQVRRAQRSMKVIGDLAAEAGELLLVENVGYTMNDSILFEIDAFIDIFKNINPAYGCLIDIGHAMINRWDINRVVRELGDRIKGYHLHTNCGSKDSHRPLFEDGNFYSRAQIADMLSCMEEYSPNADWIIEYAPIAEMSPDLMKREVEELLKYAK